MRSASGNMSSNMPISNAEPHGRVAVASGLGRVVAITEVHFAFILTHISYRALKHFTLIGHWEDAARTNFTPGVVMVAFTVGVLILCRGSFKTYGMSTKGWPYLLNLGLACSVLLIAVEGLGLLVTRIHIDASRPPDPHAPLQLSRVLALAAIALPALIAVLALVRTQPRILGRIPMAVSIPLMIGLLAVVPLMAAHYQRPSMWLPAMWLFFGAGFGEEIFYRGYIQSRVDQAFGLPFRLLGFEFGLGLWVSSLLFGFVHALNTVDYFSGHFDFGWSYFAQNFVEGLFFGCVRAKTGSVLPGAIIHGFDDVFARLPNILP